MKLHYKAVPSTYQYWISDPQAPWDTEAAICCTVTFADRKSISIRINKDGSVNVRAPYYAPASQVNAFVDEKQHWITAKRKQILLAAMDTPVLTPEQEKQAALLEQKLRKAAREYIPSRIAYYRQLTGGTYHTIAVRDQKSRWGSCSGRGTLSFNYRLMLAPPKVLDYVIVHELCHLTHMDHSPAFWQKVETIMPDYKQYRQWLKVHGRELTLEHYLFSST